MSLQSFASFIKNNKPFNKNGSLISNPSSHFLTHSLFLYVCVSLAGLEQHLQPQIATGCVSPRSAEQGVDIMQMLTKARDDYDKVRHISLKVFSFLTQLLRCIICTRGHQCTVHFLLMFFFPLFFLFRENSVSRKKLAVVVSSMETPI